MLSELRLQHFRSYVNDSFEFGSGVNIIVGPNASGKTNLLEAILLTARGSSYRAKDPELIRFKQPWARLDARLNSGSSRSIKLVADKTPAKSYELDGKSYLRLTLNHSLPVVLFEPNHLQLVSGGPERRRDYLDDLLEQTKPGYGALRRQYRRSLAQRNTLLKQKSPQLETQLFPWNVRLSQLAGQLVQARSQLVAELQRQLPKLYRDLSRSKTAASLLYASEWPPEGYESNLLKKLEANLAVDHERGFTGSGPHREDLQVLFNGHPAQDTASRGEMRTLVLALKILELRLLREARGQTPLLLLDDVFSELDGARRRALTEHLRDYQTFITTTDADVVLQHFTDECQIIPLIA